MYKTNDRAARKIKQTLTELKRQIGNSTIVFEDFNTPHSLMNRTLRRRSTRK